MERVIFAKGGQKTFMRKVCENYSLKDFLRKNKIYLNIPYETFRQYCSGEITLPLSLFETLCTIGKINKNMFEFKLLPANWGAKKGGKSGIKSLFEKYDVKTLNEWRRKGGLNSPNKFKGGENTKYILLPEMNNELAEFIGIILGDGTLTKYFIRISLNAKDERPYSEYIVNLCEKLFHIKPLVRKERNANLLSIELFSVKMCKFLNETLKIPFGNKIKNKSKIPEIIMNDSALSLSCLRGLVDTDGTVCDYVYFSSYNPILIKQVEKLNDVFKLFTSKNNVLIGSGKWENTMKYFKLVGSSNLKHIVRFNEKFKYKKFVSADNAYKLFKNYKGVKIPFKLGVVSPAHCE